MTTDLVPAPIRDLYDVREWKHAAAILRYDFPAEWQDIMDVLSAFRLRRADILTPGGRKSLQVISQMERRAAYARYARCT